MQPTDLATTITKIIEKAISHLDRPFGQAGSVATNR